MAVEVRALQNGSWNEDTGTDVQFTPLCENLNVKSAGNLRKIRDTIVNLSISIQWRTPCHPCHCLTAVRRVSGLGWLIIHPLSLACTVKLLDNDYP